MPIATSRSPEGGNFKKPAYEGDRIMWAPEISDKANVIDKTVYKWFSNGTLPAVKIGGRRGCWESDFYALLQPKSA